MQVKLSLTFPNRITLIVARAFRGCTNLGILKFLGIPPTINIDVFDVVTVTVMVNPKYFNNYFTFFTGTGLTLLGGIIQKMLTVPLKDSKISGDIKVNKGSTLTIGGEKLVPYVRILFRYCHTNIFCTH